MNKILAFIIIAIFLFQMPLTEGKTTRILESNIKEKLLDISFHLNSVLIVGEKGIVLKKSDNSFYSLPRITDESLNSISFNQNYGLIVGNNGVILKYEDEKLILLSSPIKTNLTAISFSKEKAIIVGEKGIMLKYENNSFDIIETNTEKNLNAITFNGKSAMIVGDRIVLKYENNSVKKIYENVYNFNSISFKENKAVIVGNYGNKGIIFEYYEDKFYFLAEVENSLNDISFNENYGLIVGNKGTILKYQEGKLIQIKSKTDKNLCSVESNDYSIIVGEDGLILRYGIENFFEIESKTDSILYSIAFNSENQGIIVGGGMILKYSTNSIRTLYNVEYNLIDVIFIEKDIIIIGNKGDKGFIFKFANEHLQIISEFNKTLNSISFNGKYSLIVGNGGTVIKYENEKITSLETKIKENLFDVAFNGKESIIVGENGTILKYNNSFIKLNSNTNKNLNAISFNENFGLIVGDGIILKYFNNSINEVYNSSYNFNDVSLNDEIALIVANKGVVLRYEKNISLLETNLINTFYKVSWSKDKNFAIIIGSYGKILSYSLVDIEISDISFSNEFPREGEVIEVKVKIKNVGEKDLYNISLIFYDGNIEFSRKNIEIIKIGEEFNITVNWKIVPFFEGGKHIISIIAYSNTIEKDTENNIVQREINVQSSWISLLLFYLPIVIVIVIIIIILKLKKKK